MSRRSIQSQGEVHPKHQHLENAGPSVQRRRTSIGAERKVGKTLQVNEIGFIDVGDTGALVVCEGRKVELSVG